MPYRRRRLFWIFSVENSVILRLWVIAVSHAPFSVARQRRFNPAPSEISFCLMSASISKYSHCFHASALKLRTQALCFT